MLRFEQMCGKSISSKAVYVFFILRRRVQRYCTAVRGVKNKKYIRSRTGLHVYKTPSNLHAKNSVPFRYQQLLTYAERHV